MDIFLGAGVEASGLMHRTRRNEKEKAQFAENRKASGGRGPEGE